MALPPITGRSAPPAAGPAPAADDAKSAAQRAFFQAALAKAGAPQAASAPAPVATSAPRAVQPAATRVQAERVIPPQPDRILRPGSIIDIKV